MVVVAVGGPHSFAISGACVGGLPPPPVSVFRMVAQIHFMNPEIVPFSSPFNLLNSSHAFLPMATALSMLKFGLSCRLVKKAWEEFNKLNSSHAFLPMATALSMLKF